MTSEYDSITAYHYAEYRPALHEVILSECLTGQSFGLGLDIGCGTGNSSIALAAYCHKVVAIDSSPAMLEAAKAHAQISYQLFGQIEQVKGQFDIVTFAGSLPYLKSQSLVDQLNRLLKS